MPFHSRIAQAILSAVSERGPLKTTCPSEIARALFPLQWRKHMAAIRSAAFRLQEKGIVNITQKGKTVKQDVKGPIRIGTACD